MPEVIAEALVALRADDKGLERDAETKVRRAVDSAEKKAPKVKVDFDEPHAVQQFQAVRKAVGGLALFEGLKTGAQIVDLLAGRASDLAEAQNAANVQFREATPIVEQFARGASSSIGISERAALEAAAAFGGMFQNIGLASDASAILSRGAVQLAGDLASLRNLKVDDALQKIQAGLAGEAEPLRRFGVDISDAAVQAKALELGLKETHGELNQGQKELVRYQLILDQLAVAQGDFSRTGSGYANTQRTLTATLENFEATAGKTVLPILAELAADLAFVVRETDEFAKHFGGLGAVAGFVFDALNPHIALITELRKRYGEGAEVGDVYADTQAAIKSALDQATDSVEAQTAALQRQVDAALSGVAAELDQADAAANFEKARAGVTQAEKDYQDALAGTGKFAEDSARAAEKLASAHRSLARAQERVKELTWDLSDAQAAYTEAVFHFGPGSKEAEDAARDLERTQFDLKDAQDESAKSADELAKAQEDAAKAADRQKAIKDAAEALEDARRKLDRATLNAAESDVKLAQNQAASRGETLSARDATDAARTALEKWATALGNGSPFAAGLHNRAADLQGLVDKANELSGVITGTVMPALSGSQLGGPGTITTPGLAPGAVGSGSLGAGAASAGDLGGGAVGTGGLQSPVAVTINYPVDWSQMIEQAEYASGVR